MPSSQDLEILKAQLERQVTAAEAPRSWFARFTRHWSLERQEAAKTSSKAILKLISEFRTESATRLENDLRTAREISAHSTAIQSLRTQLSETEGKIRALFSSFQAASASIEAVAQSVTTLRDSVAHDLPETNRSVAALRTALGDMEHRAAIQTEKLEQTRLGLDRAQARINETRAITAEQSRSVKEIQTAIADSTIRLEASDRSLSTQINHVTTSLAEADRNLAARIGHLTEKLDGSQKAIEERTIRINTIGSAVAELTSRFDATVASVIASVDAARDTAQHESTRINAVQAELARVAEYTSSLRAQLTSLVTEVRQSFENQRAASPQSPDPAGDVKAAPIRQLNARLTALESSTNTLRAVMAVIAKSSLDQSEEAINESRRRSLFERFYLEFENRYRGSRSEIRSRQEDYLQLIAEIPALQSTPMDQAVILDLGCGRGEWLEALNARGFRRATGIDTSAVMIAECRKLSLDAEQAEANDYLVRRASNSATAITGFHIVEHLPFPVVMDLMIQARRVLAKTGLLIFETPNPENLLVATRTFHLDPTHRAPLPPQLLAFAMEQAGFANVRILRLHPYSSEHQVKENSAVATRFNEYFYSAQDYAVIGSNV